MFTKQEWSLIKELTLRDFKLKYKNSVLGFFWSLLKPLSMLTVLYVVFKIFIKVDFENYSLFLLLGIVLWEFFAESTVLGLNSIVAKASIVKKIHLKYEMLIVSACLVSLLSFLLNLIVFLVFFLIIKGLPSLLSIYMVIPILELFLISLGISFVLAIFFIRYRDIGYLWEILLRIGFWIVPVAYPLNIVPLEYMKIYMLNPLTRIFTESRSVMMDNQFPTIKFISINLVMTLIILFLGYALYKWKYKQLVEYL